ncbi:MAG: PAS domain-containing sensor histidine kinase, partial [Magnetococcales bacterium]|nr:PAS domain-containing sensor histidine kinase [Magnetococcales bacterium]
LLKDANSSLMKMDIRLERLQALMSALPHAVVIVDAKTACRMANPAFMQFIDKSAKEILAQPLEAILPDGMAKPIIPLLDRALTGERMSDWFTLASTDEEKPDLDILCQPYGKKEQGPAGLLLVFAQQRLSEPTESVLELSIEQEEAPEIELDISSGFAADSSSNETEQATEPAASSIAVESDPRLKPLCHFQAGAMGRFFDQLEKQITPPARGLYYLLKNAPADPGDQRSSISRVQQANDHIRDLLMALDRCHAVFPAANDSTTFALFEILKPVFNLVSSDFKERGIGLRLLPFSEPIQVSGSPQILSQVLLTILEQCRDTLVMVKESDSNALGGEVLMNLSVRQNQAIIAIRDNGPSFNPDVMSNDPESVENPGRALSLDLPSASVLVDEGLGGEIEVVNVIGGVEFRIKLPVAS